MLNRRRSTRGCSHGHHTTRSTQDHDRGRRRRRRRVDRDKNRIRCGSADAAADAVGLLYDATLCIGCKTCVVACQDANGLPRDTAGIDYKYDAPVALNAKAKNVIKLYKGEEGESFMKAQCMHCVDPACVSACMIGALTKGEHGIVSYNVDYCVGCRYCEIACPFNVPKFEWAKSTPKIVKCELCRDRLAVGKEPACTEVCPRHAVIYGKRTDLMLEAKRRIAAEPDKYVQKVYGETEGGGTQCLYISHVPFDKLGLPSAGRPSGGRNWRAPFSTPSTRGSSPRWRCTGRSRW